MLSELFMMSSEQFEQMYQTNEQCYHLLSRLKWRDGFRCRHCGHTHYCEGRNPGSLRCTRCKREESATAHTIFHHCRLPIRTSISMALYIYHNPDVSIYELCKKYGIREMTCWRMRNLVKKMKKHKP